MDADADVAQKRNALMSDTDATLTELCEDGQDFHGNRTVMRPWLVDYASSEHLLKEDHAVDSEDANIHTTVILIELPVKMYHLQ